MASLREMKSPLETFQQAVVAHRKGAFDKAEKLYSSLLKSQPRHYDARYNLALLLLQNAKWQKALHQLNTLLEQGQRAADIYFSRGRALSKLGSNVEALQSLEKAHHLRPLDANILLEIGNELMSLQRIGDAIEYFRKSGLANPNSVESIGALAQALIVDRQYPAAAALLKSAVDRFSKDTRILFAYGQALFCLEEFEDSISLFRRVLDLDPNHAPSQLFYLLACREIGLWDEEEEAFLAYRKNLDASPSAAPKLALSQGLTYFPFSIDELHKLACARAEQVKEKVRLQPRIACRLSPESDVIRIGYLSPDFRHHPTMQLIVDLFAGHRRDWFSVHGYNVGPTDDSEWYRRAVQNLDTFSDLSKMSFFDAAKKIAEDKIDVLIDLSTYTQFARPEIPAMRPAPIQLQWVGFPCTSGSDCYDYIVADEVVVPEDHARFYTERIFWMPHSYLPYRHLTPIEEPLTPSEVGLPPDVFVFCSFNVSKKIGRGTVVSWCRILQQVDNAVLWLLDTPAPMKSTLRGYAARYGIEPQRLIFAPKLELSDHLRRMQSADLFLDNFIYGAHTTALDALSVGLPILTVKGDTFASRVGASFLTSIGLPELICRDAQEYENRAVSLARNSNDLRMLRDRLASNRVSRPLFDAETFIERFDRGLKFIVDQTRRGCKKVNIRVGELS